MKHITFLLLLAFSCHAISQTNHPDGLYKEFYENGQIKVEGNYRNDKKVSVWKKYYENGQLRAVYSHDANGKRSGIEQTYSESGILKKETNRALHGGLITKEFYEDGVLYLEYNFNPSKGANYKTGEYKEYYKNGMLKIEAAYVEDELNGLWKQFYETGEKEWEVNFTEGYKQGLYRQFHKNGQIKIEGFHELDKKEGKENQYDFSGNLVNTLTYKKGKLRKSDNDTALTEIDIPDALLQHVPVFPDCEDFAGNEAIRDCTSRKIAEFVNRNFDTSVLKTNGVSGRALIHVMFKIDKSGEATDIRAKSSFPALENEAIRAIQKLPRMKPALVRGQPVSVPYELPIVFSVKYNQD